jgi:3-phosphoglycerate kinase
MKSVRDAEVKDKKVFLRVDFNVPLENGKIQDNNRIVQALPTIEFLIEKRAKIIIGTHIGRPKGKFSPEFSTIPIAEELARLLGKKVKATDHVISPAIEEEINLMKPGDILVLGNLRFHEEEEKNSESFAKALANYVDVYVNDAFAVSHRFNASVEAITNFLPSFSGLLMEAEITSLDLLVNNPEHPFVLVIGGAKVSDKAGLLVKLAEKADSALIGGAVGNTFLAAKNVDVSKSLIDKEMIQKCKEILTKYQEKILLPKDYNKKDVEGGFNILDIGPNTITDYKRVIAEAKCIFWNGNMGYTEDEKYKEGTLSIAQAMADNPNTKVIAGGDTVGFVDKYNLRDRFSFVSTGGGAAMQYLAGEPLPGIEALNKASL